MNVVPRSERIVGRDRVRLLPRGLAAPLVLGLIEDEPVPGRKRAPSAHLGRQQAPLVVRLGRERADLRAQAPGVLEEDPALRRHGLVLAEQVLQDRHLRLVRLRALRDLRQLVRVAEEDEVARDRADRHRVGERHLARLVHEERVDEALEVLAREEPRRAGDELELVVEQITPAVGASR